jgi:PEP-CTERM motif
MKFMYCALSALLLGLTSAAAAQNLVIGGDFESPVISPPYRRDVTPTGWTGTGDLVVQGYDGAVSSGNGNQWFDLNPNGNAGTGISQSISLNAGMTYNFSFLYNGDGVSTTTIAVTIGSFLSGNISTAALNVYGGTPWQRLAATFDALVGGPAALTFMPNGTLSGNFIDNVQVSAIPEPEIFALLLAGLGLMGFTARRRMKELG